MRRRNLKREDGVVMTEFALILPVFVFIIVGLLAFGRILFYWIETNHEASEAARWAVVDRNPYAPQTLQQHVATGSTVEFQSDVKVCIDFPEGGTPDLGEPVRVKVEKPFTVIPLLGVGTIAIRGASTQRIERFSGGAVAPTAYSTGQNIGTCS